MKNEDIPLAVRMDDKSIGDEMPTCVGFGLDYERGSIQKINVIGEGIVMVKVGGFSLAGISSIAALDKAIDEAIEPAYMLINKKAKRFFE